MPAPAGRTAGRGPSRRSVLAGALGAGLTTAVLAACTGNDPGTRSTDGSPPGTSAAPGPETSVPAPRMPTVSGTVAEGMDTPWSIAFVPGGTALVSERDTGTVRRVARGLNVPLGTVPGVVHGGEGGLLGLAASPGFAADRMLYAYYTASDGNRISRFAVTASVLGAEEVLLGGIPSGRIHNGGRIKFGPDGLLYVGTGDAGDRGRAQDGSSLGGKILCLGPDGTPAPDNPSGTAVYSTGHRNVQGLAWDGDGRFWATEFGPDRDDELNLIQPGANYGWPRTTGAAEASGSEPAVHVWPSTAEASPSALAIHEGTAYAACLRGQRLWILPLPASGTAYDAGGTLPGAVEFMRGSHGRLRDVVVVPSAVPRTGTAPGDAPGPRLWVATNEGADSRILELELARAPTG